MTALAASDVTVTVLEQRNISNRQRENLVKVVFGNSTLTYPSGGITLPSAGSFGFKSPLRYLIPIQDRNLTSLVQWRHDYASGTLRGYGYAHIPPIVVKESVTLTSNAGTLKYPPAYIIEATGTISAAVAAMKMVPTSATLGAGEMSVNWTTGAVATRSADSVSALTISYIPQQPSGPFSYANMVVDEVVALATGNNNLAFRAAAISYAYQTSATAARLVWAHANASGKLALDINNSGNTTISANSAQNGKNAVFTYLKYSGFENNVSTTFIDQASVTLTSEVKEWGKTAGDRVGGLVIPGLGGQLITFHDTSTYDEAYICNETGTPANGLSTFNLVTQVLTTAQTGDSETLEDVPFLFLSPNTQPFGRVAELTVNDAPTATTLYFIAIA